MADDSVCVIGIPEATGVQEATRRGYRIPSRGLASLLAKGFEVSLEEAVPFDDQGRETIAHMGMAEETLARESKIEVSDLQKITGRSVPKGTDRQRRGVP